MYLMQTSVCLSPVYVPRLVVCVQTEQTNSMRNLDVLGQVSDRSSLQKALSVIEHPLDRPQKHEQVMVGSVA